MKNFIQLKAKILDTLELANEIPSNDLKILVIFALASVFYILVSPFNQTVLRIIFAVIMFCFLPGYAFISALFPKKDEITKYERLILSIIFSIIIVVFDSLALSVTFLTLESKSIILSLFCLTILFTIIAYISRACVSIDERFVATSLYLVDPCSKNKNRDDSKEKQPHIFHIANRKKIRGLSHEDPADIKNEEKIAFNHLLERTLIVSITLATIIIIAILTQGMLDSDDDKFTALYILNAEGEAKNYPSEVLISEPINLIVGIENHESEDLNYTLQVTLDGVLLDQYEYSLEDGEIFEQNLALVPKKLRLGKQKLEMSLYKGNQMYIPYSSVHLWITETADADSFRSDEFEKLEDIIEIVNPAMDSSDGWIFLSENVSITKGSYQDSTGFRSSRAYVIENTYKGKLNRDEGYKHLIQQEIESNETMKVLLSAFLMDTYTDSKDKSQSKQVIVNGDIVWSDDINGKEGWQHLQVPITLNEGRNTIGFALTQKPNLNIQPTKMIIDEIHLISLSQISPYLNDDLTVENIAPTSKVLSLPLTIQNENFTVKWKGDDDESGIYYYNIDYSIDGTKWLRWLTKTTDTSGEFQGDIGRTYYFRSQAVDKAYNVEQKHVVADTSITIDVTPPEIEVLINPNPAKDSTTISVQSEEPLKEVACFVSPYGFAAEEIKMNKISDSLWRGIYAIELNVDHYVEIYAEDIVGNKYSTIETINVDNSLDEMYIEIDTETTSTDLEVRFIYSIAFKTEPVITVEDSDGYELNVDLEEKTDNEYTYIVRIEDDDEITDGIATITIYVHDINSKTQTKTKKFIISS